MSFIAVLHPSYRPACIEDLPTPGLKLQGFRDRELESGLDFRWLP
jgi:hypothetical protein